MRLGSGAAAGPGALRRLPTLRECGIPYRKLALRTDPAVLAARIAERTGAMLDAGLVEEAERIGADAVAADAVGYREALAYLAGFMTWDELRAALARATRRYAKRQLTWLRAEPNLTWIAAGDLPAALDVTAAMGWPIR